MLVSIDPKPRAPRPVWLRAPAPVGENYHNLKKLVQKLDLRWVKAGDTLVNEAEQGDSMFVVVQGVVNVTRDDRVIAVMSEGSFFGEMALLTDSPRLASVEIGRAHV